MKLVIFGLSISSSWGNGHATLWRGLCRALAERGHNVQFFERDVPYYASHRDMTEIPGGGLHLYADWKEIVRSARAELADADVTMVTPYCPDALAAAELCGESPGLRTFYDLDTGVTLQRLAAGLQVDYIGPRLLRDYDLVLSYIGGRALDELRSRLGANATAPLYGSVDPAAHYPVPPLDRFRADLSYLGTYAEDRQEALERLLIEPARRLPQRRFRIGGALYPADFPWTSNIYFDRHLPPAEHRAFYCSSRMTLNVTRRGMADMGYCPSGRFFEAAACGIPVLTDQWDGLDHFFTPGEQVIVAEAAEDAVAALEMSDAEISRIGRAARERTLTEHTADARVRQLERLLDTYASGSEPALQKAEA
jgi:spore maturation protein CgeB